MSKKNVPLAGGPQTTAVHAGEFPDPSTGASAPNLVMSSTYVTEEAAGVARANNAGGVEERMRERAAEHRARAER